MWPTFTPVADHALLVAFGDVIDDDTGAAVVALDRALAAAPAPGMTECVPAFVNLLIDFDPLHTDQAEVRAHVEHLLRDLRYTRTGGTLHEVEVCYDGDGFAPDLAVVAGVGGLSTEAVIAAHLQAEYTVCLYGFAPGYAYLSGVPQAIQVPRKPAALRDVPAGSVLIAGPQCLVSTLTMPTGWSIIGRSPTPILQRDAARPFRFDVGDRVRFRRIDPVQYATQFGAQRGAGHA